jgi:hypothetical protein
MTSRRPARREAGPGGGTRPRWVPLGVRPGSCHKGSRFRRSSLLIARTSMIEATVSDLGEDRDRAPSSRWGRFETTRSGGRHHESRGSTPPSAVLVGGGAKIVATVSALHGEDARGSMALCPGIDASKAAPGDHVKAKTRRRSRRSKLQERRSKAPSSLLKAPSSLLKLSKLAP